MRISITAVLTALLVMTGCGPSPTGDGTPGTETIRVAYVTNGIDPFWSIAEAGAMAAAEELGVSCEVLMPPRGLVDQTQMVESLLARNIDGIAISPIDAANQVDLINEAAARTVVITQDSDAPDSDRLCFIGMDNYLAGRQAGQLVKEAMPDGGSVMIFVGRLEQLNAQQRRQGVIDELLDRPVGDTHDLAFDPPGFTHLEGKYPIIGTRTDNFDYARAKANAEDAMASHPDLGCMVGLFAYNIPNCLEAVKAAGRTGEIKLVSFDEADETLEGIRDGHVQGTISQQPYEYGYQSVVVLKALIEGDDSVIPEDGFIDIASIVVTRDNVDAFQAELDELRGG